MPKVAVVQMISSASVKSNLKKVEDFFIDAKGKQADLLVLPENFAFMGMKENDKLAIAENYGEGEIQDRVRQLAKRYDLWAIAGTLSIKAPNKKVKSSCLVFDNNGLCAARYDKIHLFDVRVSEQEAHQESATVDRGDELVVVDTPVGKVGLSVCYDLRFPELYRQLVQRGAELLSIPSAFTAVTGVAHWEVLLRARAIENLSYVVASNQGGQHENGRQTYGHSMIIEPWGKVVAQQETGEGIITADIDLQRLQQLRQQFPSNEHHVLLNR
ncbi:nitrilase [Legionella nautarum]|uniref:Nitrilase n=1 Tax=Legionella nautarum TaxID=45070 RepID=A0A0W0X3X3_9GAMM|nr:carbon-nitrogen hydrolase family protein [Legionella nautarum]KTD39283.1 nitrilase [Legionella nautarum]